MMSGVQLPSTSSVVDFLQRSLHMNKSTALQHWDKKKFRWLQRKHNTLLVNRSMIINIGYLMMAKNPVGNSFFVCIHNTILWSEIKNQPENEREQYWADLMHYQWVGLEVLPEKSCWEYCKIREPIEFTYEANSKQYSE